MSATIKVKSFQGRPVTSGYFPVEGVRITGDEVFRITSKRHLMYLKSMPSWDCVELVDQDNDWDEADRIMTAADVPEPEVDDSNKQTADGFEYDENDPVIKRRPGRPRKRPESKENEPDQSGD